MGKRNRFPVNGTHAVKPGRESHEKPLLLHPCWDNPSEHFEIDETGVLGAKTACGEMCINIFGLNLRGLPGHRKNEYDGVKLKISILAQSIVNDPNGRQTKDLIESIQKLKDGHGEFTSVALKAIADSDDNLNPLKALIGKR